MIVPDREGAAYRQLAGVLRDRIRSGELPAGQRMPSEKDLHDEFGLARETVRRALAVLRGEGLIGAIGVTNFDAAHLALAFADGIPIASNQVSFSLIDHRAAGALSDLCKRTGVKLLAYGTLCGGFLSEKWLGKAEPTSIADWSRSKYKRFIDTAGGWGAFQAVLAAADRIARKHRVSISNVASRWVDRKSTRLNSSH